ncbi:MAG TPA: response regulator [Pyrinomonadaceae bacterium]|nr:response regulator [Pyrinomonadaceae bacterium]
MLHSNHTRSFPLFLSAHKPIVSGGAIAGDDELILIKAKRLKILLIDDRSDYRAGLSFMLTQKYEAEVTDVASGSEAIKNLRAGRVFDLIFIDIRMSPMNGFDTYLNLRTIDPEVPMVMMSAHAGDEELERAERLGVELLHKPILDETITDLLMRIESR